MCVCVCVIAKALQQGFGAFAGRKPMWEPDPVLCFAVDYTVNTEKEEVILVSSSFSHTICIQPYSGCFLCHWLCSLTGNHFTVHLQLYVVSVKMFCLFLWRKVQFCGKKVWKLLHAAWVLWENDLFKEQFCFESVYWSSTIFTFNGETRKYQGFVPGLGKKHKIIKY